MIGIFLNIINDAISGIKFKKGGIVPCGQGFPPVIGNEFLIRQIDADEIVRIAKAEVSLEETFAWLNEPIKYARKSMCIICFNQECSCRF